METPLSRQCNEALHARSLPELLRSMVDFSEARGFGRVSATVLTKHSPTLSEYQFIASVATDYVHEFENMEAAKLDPVSQHVAVSSAPMVWDQSTYVGCGQGQLWEIQAPYGYRSGRVIGFHLPRGRSFLFGPDSDRPICASSTRMREIVEDFHLFASHAQAAAFELCTAFDPPAH